MTDAKDFYEERAAVRQWDGGASQEEAEAMAVGDVALRYGWAVAVKCLQGENDGK